jgi:hypothetical protein
MIVLLILALIPVIMIVLTKRFLYSWFLSSILGIIVLWINMIVLELKAVDSDLDIIFALAMMMWATILSILYGILFIAAQVIFQLFRNKNKE